MQEQLIQHLRWPTRAIVICWVWYENDFYLKLCRIDWWLFWFFFFNEDYPICEKLSSENYLPYENWQEWWRIVFNKDSSFHYGHIIFIFQYKSYCKPLKQIIQMERKLHKMPALSAAFLPNGCIWSKKKLEAQVSLYRSPDINKPS